MALYSNNHSVNANRADGRIDFSANDLVKCCSMVGFGSRATLRREWSWILYRCGEMSIGSHSPPRRGESD